MKAVGYIRVSTEDQKNGDGPERQKDTIASYAERNGLEIVETLVDDGFSASSGAHIERGKLGKFLKEADTGKFKGYALLVEREDRLSRLGNTETLFLKCRILKAGVSIHFVNEGNILREVKDLDRMENAVGGTFRSVTNQEFSQKLSERVGRAWAKKKKAAAESKKLFTSRLPAWLEVKDGKPVEVVEDYGSGKNRKIPAATIREIFKLASQGVGSENIAHALNGKALSRGWIVRTLANRATLGEFQPGKSGEVIPDYFPRVVEQSLFDEVRRQMEAKRRNGTYAGGSRTSHKTFNLFTGLIFDVTTEATRALHFQHVPRGRYLMSAFVAGQQQNRVPYDKIESAVLSFLTQADWQAIASETETEEVKTARAELEVLLREIDKVSRRIELDTKDRETEEDESVRRVLARSLAKDEEALATLTETKERLQSNVDAAIALIEPLYSPQTLLELIRQGSPESETLRLKLRSEIAKRVSKISVMFNANPTFNDEGEAYGKGDPNVWIFVEYVNGVVHFASIEENGTVQTIHNGGKDVLRTFELVAREAKKRRKHPMS